MRQRVAPQPGNRDPRIPVSGLRGGRYAAAHTSRPNHHPLPSKGRPVRAAYSKASSGNSARSNAASDAPARSPAPGVVGPHLERTKEQSRRQRAAKSSRAEEPNEDDFDKRPTPAVPDWMS